MPENLQLEQIRKETLDHLARLQLPGQPFGAYDDGSGRGADFYASMDAVIIRTVMGEDLRSTLSESERGCWAEHIGSFQESNGSFRGAFNRLSTFHQLGMAIGALGVLGHPLPYAHDYFFPIREIQRLDAWLETIDWRVQWKASHEFWGAMHCFSMSVSCSPVWRAHAFAWLNQELDPATGWWRRGVPHADRHQAMGGSAHILPFYEHHARAFPFPEPLIDSILDLQLADGNWLAESVPYPVSYLDLDALYLLKFAVRQVPYYRTDEIRRAACLFADFANRHWMESRDILFGHHPHHLLGFIGAVGLLQQLMPENYQDENIWSDIFTDRRLYQTDTVIPCQQTVQMKRG